MNYNYAQTQRIVEEFRNHWMDWIVKKKHNHYCDYCIFCELDHDNDKQMYSYVEDAIQIQASLRDT